MGEILRAACWIQAISGIVASLEPDLERRVPISERRQAYRAGVG